MMHTRAGSQGNNHESLVKLRAEAARDPLVLMRRIGCRAILFMSEEQQRIMLRWAGNVVTKYLEALGKIGPSGMSGSSLLPHPARDIEAALFALLLKCLLAGEEDHVALLHRGIASLPKFSEPFKHGTNKPVQELSASALKEAERLAQKERELFTVYGYPNKKVIDKKMIRLYAKK